MLFKRLAILGLAIIFILASFAPAVYAESTMTVEETAEAQSTNDSKNDSDIPSKEVFVNKIKSLFPEKFGEVSLKDFDVEREPRYPEEIEQYFVHYHPESEVHASFVFIGEDLTLANYDYNSNENRKEALFPPEVSKEEAIDIASKFMNRMVSGDNFELDQDYNNYIPPYNTPLTEPIEYRVQFNKVVNGISVRGQSYTIVVLSNGEVVGFHGPFQMGEMTFEDASNLQSKEEVLSQLKSDVDLDLEYRVERDFQTNKEEVYLTYVEDPFVHEINAKTGQYEVDGEFVDELSNENEELKMLSGSSKQANPVTEEEAIALVKELLGPMEENTRLVIEDVREETLPDGTVVFDIMYMLRTENSGYGTNVQINKDTGELIDYHSFRDHQPGETFEAKISADEALELAVEYIGEYGYTNMGEFAYPMREPDTSKEDDQYHFLFPRVKNGIEVSGNRIHVGVSKIDGSLKTFVVNKTMVKDWPKVDDAVSKEQALEDLKAQMDLKLYYVTNDPRDKGEMEYELRYLRNDEMAPGIYNAVTGEWEETNYGDNGDLTFVEHPWAEEELNFMIANRILEVDDLENFNPNATVTKGEALEIIVKSLTRHYERPGMDEGEPVFENIGPDHPLYSVIRRSIDMGIIETDQKTFDLDGVLTREQLAKWYVRALGLDSVAEKKDIFSYKFNDAENIGEEFKGYVVLADAFEILNQNANGNFMPKENVTYAQLAVSCIMLAKVVTTEELDIRY